MPRYRSEAMLPNYLEYAFWCCCCRCSHASQTLKRTFLFRMQSPKSNLIVIIWPWKWDFIVLSPSHIVVVHVKVQLNNQLQCSNAPKLCALCVRPPGKHTKNRHTQHTAHSTQSYINRNCLFELHTLRCYGEGVAHVLRIDYTAKFKYQFN